MELTFLLRPFREPFSTVKRKTKRNVCCRKQDPQQFWFHESCADQTEATELHRLRTKKNKLEVSLTCNTANKKPGKTFCKLSQWRPYKQHQTIQWILSSTKVLLNPCIVSHNEIHSAARFWNTKDEKKKIERNASCSYASSVKYRIRWLEQAPWSKCASELHLKAE